MLKRIAILFAATLLLGMARANAADTVRTVVSRPAMFPVAPHDDVTIEWWYLNAHVTTERGRHLALIGSFFRLGNALAQGAASGKGSPAVQSHYLIYAVTDEDAQTHRAFSMADRNSLALMQQLATLSLMRDPSNTDAQNLIAMAAKGEFPQPTTLIPGVCKVVGTPLFSANYGPADSVRQFKTSETSGYHLTLGAQKGSACHVELDFSPSKPPMYVGGDGNTGIARPDDMKYVSLTRCAVIGTIDTGQGAEKVTAGDGWFDHQWGDTWTTQAVGWDWFGVQLADGRDILFFRQRRLRDGSIFQPLATIEEKSGHLTVTRNLVFTPDPGSVWESPATHVRYPLKWTVTLPDAGLSLTITTPVKEQEMPVLASGGAIWEGTVDVAAKDSHAPPAAIAGKGYMELVGYAAPAVARETASH